MQKDRYIATRNVGILGILCNLLLLIIKVIFGIISKSYGMIADAFNSAGDIFASSLTFIGNKIANEPSDESHNYGHGKAEYIFSLLIGLSMAICSLKIFYESVLSIINQEKLTFSLWLVAVCIITILTKLLLYIYVRKQGKKYDSMLIMVNSKDHINDIFVTTGTLLGILASLIGIYWLDGLIGCIISVWIFYTGMKIIFDSSEILMDKSIDSSTLEKIKNTVGKFEKIDHIDKITSKPVGNNYLIIVKVSVDGNMTVNESHQIAGKLKYNLLQIEHIYDVIVHINPA